MGPSQQQQQYPQAQPSPLPSPPYQGENPLGRLLRQTGTDFLFPGGLDAIREDPTSFRSMTDYLGATVALASLFGGARGGVKGEVLKPLRPHDPVVAAAYKMPDGTIHTGAEHMFILDRYPEIESNPHAKSGYVTKSGKFVDEHDLRPRNYELEPVKPISEEEMPKVLDLINRLGSK